MGWLSGLWSWLSVIFRKIFKVIDIIVELAQWIVDFMVVLLDVFVYLFLGILYELLGYMLDAAVSILNSVSVPFNPSTYYSMIPSDVSAIMGLIGLPQAISMIVASLLIRLVLQLIPFTRLGS